MNGAAPPIERVVFDLSADALRRERRLRTARRLAYALVGVDVALFAFLGLFLDFGNLDDVVSLVARAGIVLVIPVWGLWIVKGVRFPRELVFDSNGVEWGFGGSPSLRVSWAAWEGFIEIASDRNPLPGRTPGLRRFRASLPGGPRALWLQGVLDRNQARELVNAARARGVRVTEPSDVGWWNRERPTVIGGVSER